MPRRRIPSWQLVDRQDGGVSNPNTKTVTVTKARHRHVTNDGPSRPRRDVNFTFNSGGPVAAGPGARCIVTTSTTTEFYQSRRHSEQRLADASFNYATFGTFHGRVSDNDGGFKITRPCSQRLAVAAGGPYTVNEGTVGCGGGSRPTRTAPCAYEWDLNYDGVTFNPPLRADPDV